jgi:DNA (cytosine-5)-methyltransferase 1
VDCRNGVIDEVNGTLQAKPNGGVSYNLNNVVLIPAEIILRRLTPTECARLQGMPDWWCDDVPHSDTAEYKMWGNGMALPCVLYVMEGIKEVMESEE